MLAAMVAGHSFVISESGYYGCCLTFYREVDARPFWLAYECVHPRNTNPDDQFQIKSPLGGSRQDLNVSDQSNKSATWERSKTVFMPISVCLVSRSPYLGVLKNCLTSVFPQLLANPTEMIGILEELMADLSCVRKS